MTHILGIIGYTAEQLTDQWLFEWAPYCLPHAEQTQRVVEEQVSPTTLSIFIRYDIVGFV